MLPSHPFTTHPITLVRVKWEHFCLTFDPKEKVGGKWRKRSEEIKIERSSWFVTSPGESEISLIFTWNNCRSSRKYFSYRNMKNVTVWSAGAVSLATLILTARWLGFPTLFYFPLCLCCQFKESIHKSRMCVYVSVLIGVCGESWVCVGGKEGLIQPSAFSAPSCLASGADSLRVITCDWQARFQQHANRKWP